MDNHFMHHFFLSPHADDAVLSCGGLMADLARAGQRLSVYSLMVADAPMILPESELVQKIHNRWESGHNPFHIRREEDQQALGNYGIQPIFGEWLDCIYRTGPDGEPLYWNDDDIFGNIHPDDPLLNADLDLTPYLPIDRLYIPLGAGNHVDHQVVRKLALDCITAIQPALAIFFYEEYPYSSEAREIDRSHAGQKKRLAGQAAVQAAQATLHTPLKSEVLAISEAALQTKIDAIACYASQISTFWGDLAEMAHSVRNYAAEVGRSAGIPYGERLWTFT
jgi:LmbE family N-acetylglucosaminyl deacetylase